MPDTINSAQLLPETIKAVIERLIVELPLRERTRIARMEEDDLIFLDPALGTYIRDKYLWNGNVPLIIDCIQKSGKEVMDENRASAMIIHALWEYLRDTHRLRVVK